MLELSPVASRAYPSEFVLYRAGMTNVVLPMRRITIAPVRTWRYKRMRPCGELFNGLAALSLYPFWPGYIINMSGYDFRKGQAFRL